MKAMNYISVQNFRKEATEAPTVSTAPVRRFGQAAAGGAALGAGVGAKEKPPVRKGGFGQAVAGGAALGAGIGATAGSIGGTISAPGIGTAIGGLGGGAAGLVGGGIYGAGAYALNKLNEGVGRIFVN